MKMPRVRTQKTIKREAPKFPAKTKKGWMPTLKSGPVIPWGYEVSEEDPLVLNPIPEQLDLLQIGMEYIHKKKSTYQEVANWLTVKTGRSITKEGLMRRVKKQENQRREWAAYERWIRRAKEAAEKARKIEEKFLDKKYDELWPGKRRIYSVCTCGAGAVIPPEGKNRLPAE